MVKQIKILTQIQLCNIFNLNAVRFSKDKRKRLNLIGLMAVWLMLLIMMIFYIGALSVGFINMGIGQILPMYLITISSSLIFFFGLFKAGSIIFQKNSYDVLCSLPVSQTEIVLSRFFNMYIGNLLISLAIIVPGIVIYGYYLKPQLWFYIAGIIVTVFLPLLPMTITTMLSAIITAIASRMKHKSLVTTALSILLIVCILPISFTTAQFDENITTEMLVDITSLITDLISKIYPPAVWASVAMTGKSFVNLALYLGISVLLFAVMVIIVSKNFTFICRGLYSTTAKHTYKIEELKLNSVLKTLWIKEWKRYLASSIYVTNTIIGPIMMVLFAASVLVMGTEKLNMYMQIPGGINNILPFVIGAMSCVMTTTCTSISMEGKQWWIIKSLPVSTKDILNSKLLMNLSLISPFYLIAEILLIIATKPSLVNLLWLIIIPAVFIVFSCVFGIFINLHFAVFDWENEVTVVKQSATAMLGGLGGFVIIILCAFVVIFFKQLPTDIIKSLITLFIVGLTGILYVRNNKVDLKEI